jgi:5-methylcytosine-specific restriction enzyme B
MPPRFDYLGDAVYAAAERFVRECLRTDGSLFTPGRPVWTAATMDDFHQRFVVGGLHGSGSFAEKLAKQLEGADDATIQFAAEALFFNYLCEIDTGAQHKRKTIDAILARLQQPVVVPPELQATYETGIATVGTAKVQRWQNLAFLTEFARRWKALPEEARDQALASPAAFREFVMAIPKNGASIQVEGLLYLVHPEAFENIVSLNVKKKIAQAFAEYLDGTEANVDEQLATIRRRLTGEHGESFHFYDDPLLGIWSGEAAPPDGRWDDFLTWSAKIYETPEFDAEERDYKLKVAEKMRIARVALEENDSEWLGRLRSAFGSPNNLTSFHAHGPFLDWCAVHPDDARALLERLWEGELTEERLASAFDAWGAADSPGNQISVASVLLLGRDPYEWAPFRAMAFSRAYVLVGTDEAGDLDASPGGARARRYFAALDFLDDVRDRLADRGVQIRDRLDAQGIVWVIHNGPPTSWSAEEQQAFLAWRDGDVPPPPPPPGGVEISSATAKLAEELYVTRPWLQEIVDLLNEKRQVIFYGPPGTGKTFVAQALARHVEVTGGDSRIVQFHPSYSYEDFFEGYRPRIDGSGDALAFDLRRGPLRDLAASALASPEAPHLLVIDEINRGNIAKIFGELYFLLEYRRSAIRLQYSPDEEFRLPENLFVIGTMNTADRSIALIDSALRRRFYFVPFLPREQPIRDVLSSWLAANGHGQEPAELLAELNKALVQSGAVDDEFAIGPSYFMPRQGEPDVDRVWRHAILPLLEERFYGRKKPAEIEQEFGLAAIRSRLAPPAEE